jgi:hypothetical protein
MQQLQTQTIKILNVTNKVDKRMLQTWTLQVWPRTRRATTFPSASRRV